MVEHKLTSVASGDIEEIRVSNFVKVWDDGVKADNVKIVVSNRFGNETEVLLDNKGLSDFIGILLHVQAKRKKR